MAIRVWRDQEGYMAEVSPPESKFGVQATEGPLSQDEMRRFPISMGVHVQDCWDAILGADGA